MPFKTPLMCLGQNKMAARFVHISAQEREHTFKKMLQNIKNEQGYSEDFMKGEIENLKSLAVYIKQDIRPLLH